jgi:excisionase family DNA binding protein
MGENSDGVVIVVNTRRTRLSALQHSIDSLQEGRNVRILGVIFNRVRIQITTRYYNYYYRQSPGLKPGRVMSEMENPRTGISVLWANIIQDKRSGERMFSITAAASRLGVRKATVQSWISQGHLQAERRGLRRWVRKGALDMMLEETLARASSSSSKTTTGQNLVPEEEPVREVENVNGGSTLGDAISRRDAILGFASQPDSSDTDA